MKQRAIEAARNLSALTTALIYAVEIGKDDLGILKAVNKIFSLQAKNKKKEKTK